MVAEGGEIAPPTEGSLPLAGALPPIHHHHQAPPPLISGQIRPKGDIMTKYYWVKWHIHSHKWYANGQSTHDDFETDELIENHPLRELIDRREKYGHEQAGITHPSHKIREDYNIVTWNELTEDEYYEFEGLI
jgi:hypothetical protein